MFHASSSDQLNIGRAEDLTHVSVDYFGFILSPTPQTRFTSVKT